MNVSAELPPDLASVLGGVANRIQPFGVRVVHLASVGSTNDLAARLAGDGAPEGTLVIADAQTAGRGRMGHTWYSPPLAGLYVSVVLRPSRAWFASAPESVGLITLAAGVAVAEGLRAASGITATIKWPNDVVVQGSGRLPDARRPRKVAGILAEAAGAGGEVQHVVLGFGVNLRVVAYPAEIADRATSIEQETRRPIGRATVLIETLAALADRYAALVAGRAQEVLATWRALSPSCEGAVVAWNTGATSFKGVTAGVDDTGALLVRTRGGHIEPVRSGEVTWL
jgi:BirA family transcriptional regulator, biotin operon repressor / biotin---[acetyl-CoA-carboxylase] ligase